MTDSKSLELQEGPISIKLVSGFRKHTINSSISTRSQPDMIGSLVVEESIHLLVAHTQCDECLRMQPAKDHAW
jgi:hypothetical protein